MAVSGFVGVAYLSLVECDEFEGERFLAVVKDVAAVIDNGLDLKVPELRATPLIASSENGWFHIQTALVLAFGKIRHSD